MARGGVNKAILIGNLGSDPEVKYTPSGVLLPTSVWRPTNPGPTETVNGRNVPSGIAWSSGESWRR